MKALVYDGKVKFDPRHPTPRRKDKEVLIRVLQAGICRTDLEITKGYSGFKGILGHEFVGVVEKSADPRFIGRRVVGEIVISCGKCTFCLQGTTSHCQDRSVLGIQGKNGVFAEFITLPKQNLHIIPDALSNNHAVFVEPLAAAVQILEMAHLHPQRRVIILGDGTLGLLSAQVVSLTGAPVLAVGKHSGKLKILKQRGIRICFTDEVRGEKADVVVECTGSPSGFTQAMSLVHPKGTIVLKSTCAEHPAVDLSPIVINEITIVGSRCGPFQAALRLLATNTIDVLSLISRRFPLHQGLKAIQAVSDKETVKVLLEMGN